LGVVSIFFYFGDSMKSFFALAMCSLFIFSSINAAESQLKVRIHEKCDFVFEKEPIPKPARTPSPLAASLKSSAQCESATSFDDCVERSIQAIRSTKHSPLIHNLSEEDINKLAHNVLERNKERNVHEVLMVLSKASIDRRIKIEDEKKGSCLLYALFFLEDSLASVVKTKEKRMKRTAKKEAEETLLRKKIKKKGALEILIDCYLNGSEEYRNMSEWFANLTVADVIYSS
jgi:hypothetical protein